MSIETPRIGVVTGAAAGIGRATALRLAGDLWDVGLFDRDPAGLAETERMVKSLGRRTVAVVGDVAVRADALRCIEEVSRGLGAIGLLVNNAGILRTAPFLQITAADWRQIFAVNLDGVFHLSQAVLPEMCERGSGVIVNVSSWTGKKGVPNHAAYAATKAAIINLTQTLAGEFGPLGIRVNAVCPGIIVETSMRDEAERLNRRQGLPDVDTRAQAIPLRRAGLPRDIADVIAFLASPQAAYMTGQAINVTGGHWMN